MRVLAFSLLSVLACLPSCTIRHERVGRPLPDAQAALEVGVTTKVEALALVGAPRAIVRQTDGELFLYGRRHEDTETILLIPFVPIYQRTRGSILSDRLALLFDRDGVLRSIGVDREIAPEE